MSVLLKAEDSFFYCCRRLIAKGTPRRNAESPVSRRNGEREEGEPVGTSTVKARAAIVVNFLLSSWRIREAAEREPEPDQAASLFFHGEVPSGLYER